MHRSYFLNQPIQNIEIGKVDDELSTSFGTQSETDFGRQQV